MSELMLENESEFQATKRKWTVNRTTRENYLRLFEKRKRGEKINFKERGEQVFASTLRVPTAEEIKAFCGEGYYIIEHLFDGTAGDWTFAAVVPRQDVLQQEQAAPLPQVQAPQPAPQIESSSANAINATVETVRATKELLREVAPPTTAPPPSVTKEEIARMIEESNSKLIAQMQSAQPAKPETAPDPLVSLVNTVSVLKQLGVIPEKQDSKQDAPDPTESFLTTYERFLDISARINPEGKGREGWFDKTIGAVESVAHAVPKLVPIVAPIVNQAVAQMRANTQGAQPQVEPQPAPVEQAQLQPAPAQASPEEEEALTFDAVLTNIANDILNDARPRDAIGEVTRLVVAQPEVLPYVTSLMDTPTDDLIAQLSAATGTNLSVLANAQKYVEGLKEGVRKRIQLPQPYGPVLDGAQQVT